MSTNEVQYIALEKKRPFAGKDKKQCTVLLRWLQRERSDNGEAVISPIAGQRGLPIGHGSSISDLRRDVLRMRIILVPWERSWVFRVLGLRKLKESGT